MSRVTEANRQNLKKGCIAIIEYLEDNDKVTRNKLYINLFYSTKYIQACIRELKNKDKIKTIPDFKNDMRKVFYVLV